MQQSFGRLSIAGYRTKTDLVYEALREAILAGRYPPGSRVIADQLADELGTSKVPVREAIVRLVGEGWLQIRPHVGAVVPELSPDEILETAVLRAAVEGAATRLGAPNARPETIALMATLIDRMELATRQQDPAYPRLNLEFHQAAFRDCPYPAMRTLASSLAEKTFRLRTVRFLPEYLPVSNAEHRSLLEAIRRGDGEAAERITRHHVEYAGRLLWRFALDQAEPSSAQHLSPACLCGSCPDAETSPG